MYDKYPAMYICFTSNKYKIPNNIKFYWKQKSTWDIFWGLSQWGKLRLWCSGLRHCEVWQVVLPAFQRNTVFPSSNHTDNHTQDYMVPQHIRSHSKYLHRTNSYFNKTNYPH